MDLILGDVLGSGEINGDPQSSISEVVIYKGGGRRPGLIRTTHEFKFRGMLSLKCLLNQ